MVSTPSDPGLIQSFTRLGLWLAHRHRQQRRDVVHHRLHAGADRLKARQSQQGECCGAQRGHRAGAIAPGAMGVLLELGVADPMPALDAPAVTHQLQQGLWGGAQGGEKQMGAWKGLPSRVPLVATSTIQLVPLQSSRMCCGASLARTVQVMSCPWLIS